MNPILPALVFLSTASGPVCVGRTAEHVVVIGLDGCRPEAIQQAAGPVLKSLWQSGAWSWKAQAAQPSVTQVNFAGILTGCMPAKHGIDTKEWVTGARPKVKVPTIFEIVAGEGMKAAGFLGHEKLYPAETEVKGVHFEYSPYQGQAVAPLAAKYLVEAKPQFCFIYIGDLDGAGHKHGWLSPEQLALMPGIDAALKIIVDALKESGQWDTTLLIITADHGGHGRAHSKGDPEDITVPWIAAGPLVKPGEISSPVRNLDTAATAAAALGIALPAIWDGRPVDEALGPR
ncbi:MAG: phosphodiesterase [Verrucomicrobiaceae bacterium]|nr:phosphodiesterase [Verrucomicrobiaceae bacterium]